MLKGVNRNHIYSKSEKLPYNRRGGDRKVQLPGTRGPLQTGMRHPAVALLPRCYGRIVATDQWQARSASGI